MRLRHQKILLLVLLGILLGSWFYRSSRQTDLERSRTELAKAREEIREIQAMKTLWDRRDLGKKLDHLVHTLPKKEIKTFTRKRHRIDLVLDRVEGKRLNKFLRGLSALPIQIVSLSISRNEKLYRLECRCKW